MLTALAALVTLLAVVGDILTIWMFVIPSASERSEGVCLNHKRPRTPQRGSSKGFPLLPQLNYTTDTIELQAFSDLFQEINFVRKNSKLSISGEKVTF